MLVITQLTNNRYDHFQPHTLVAGAWKGASNLALGLSKIPSQKTSQEATPRFQIIAHFRSLQCSWDHKIINLGDQTLCKCMVTMVNLRDFPEANRALFGPRFHINTMTPLRLVLCCNDP